MPSRRLLILADGGVLADDLEAWLRGRFAVERCGDAETARQALREPTAALIVVPGGAVGQGLQLASLLRRAAAGGCRTLLLDGARPLDGDGAAGLLLHLPLLPDPLDLERGLAGLSAAAGA